MGVGVREREIYQLDIASVTGHKHIQGLKVAMHCLFEVHKPDCFQHLRSDAVTKLFVCAALLQKLFEGISVHPFHLYASAQLGRCRVGVIFADIGMFEYAADFEFLFEELFVQRIAPVTLPEAFEDCQTPVLAAPVEKEGAALRV